ncbi:MAG: DUF4369 domain-containing protein [Candidatus Symbiothrix sp.]|nr:DUF4369 domain-containing protein [Candidatus Symbiothrix sp.]
MKKITLFLTVICIAFSACNKKQPLTIQGTVNPSKDFTGEMLYVISMDAVNNAVVDSVAIKDKTFSLSILPSDSFNIVRITPRNGLLTYFMQPLLVVIELGTLSADLNLSSSSHGAPLNDKLQQWKEKKEADNQTFITLHKKLGESKEEAEKEMIKQEIETQKTLSGEYNYLFVTENKGNALGKFFYKMLKESFTPEQVAALKMEE